MWSSNDDARYVESPQMNCKIQIKIVDLKSWGLRRVFRENVTKTEEVPREEVQVPREEVPKSEQQHKIGFMILKEE